MNAKNYPYSNQRRDSNSLLPEIQDQGSGQKRFGLSNKFVSFEFEIIKFSTEPLVEVYAQYAQNKSELLNSFRGFHF